MKYHSFGRTDWDVSALGFGIKYLPFRSIRHTDVSIEESVNIIRHAMASGINYFELGSLEQMKVMAHVIKEVFKGTYRKKVRISAKLPFQSLHSPRDFDYYLGEQLSTLQVDYLDLYIIFGLNCENHSKLHSAGILPWAEKAMTDGKIKGLGFSFYDDFQSFKAIVNSYDNWTFCQLQYNYVKEDQGTGSVGLQYAMEKGLAVVITEPLLGGRLTREPPKPVSEIWETALSKRKPVDWGLRWVLNRPEVSTVVVDMVTMGQLIENINIAGNSERDGLSVEELILFRQVKDAFRRLRPIPCAYCRACMPCPSGVDIPRIFEIYNDAIVYGDVVTARSIYNNGEEISKTQYAKYCNACDKCLPACPRGIAVTDWLQKAHKLLAE